MSGTGVLQALQSRGVDAHGFDPGRAVARRAASREASTACSSRCTAATAKTARSRARSNARHPLHRHRRAGLGDRDGQGHGPSRSGWTHGLPTPRFVAIGTPRPTGRRSCAELGLPLIVKPPHEGSTIGITKVESRTERAGAAFDAARRATTTTVLAEQFIAGRELTVRDPRLGREAAALPIVEIRAPARQLRLPEQVLQRRHPVPVPGAAGRRRSPREIQRLALAAYRALGCDGWGRVDVMLRAATTRRSCSRSTPRQA